MKGTSVICISAFLIAVFVVTNAVPRNYVNNYVYGFSAPHSNSSKNDMTAGARVKGDYLYSRHNVFRQGAYNQVINYSQVFNVTGNNVITFMRAHDRVSNGGRAVLVNGGPGLNRATIRFISKRSTSIDFEVEIYVKRR